MSDFKVGTLVMYRPPIGTDNLVTIGAIGEVKDGSKFSNEIPIGEVVVEFSRHKSDGYTGWWNVPTAWLIPISGPDIDIGEEDVVKTKDKMPVETV